MTTALAAALLIALTRAEIIERMRAPVITQCEGLVQVYADCPEDMRREYQMPVASFASETVKTLAGARRRKLERQPKAGIVIHLGDIRTNETTVVTRVSTNGSRIVSRIYVPSPGYADIGLLRTEIARAYLRAVCGEEHAAESAQRTYLLADPALRAAAERQTLEDWLAGRKTKEDDEHFLALMRKVIEPGIATRRDVLIFASRLFLYPSTYDRPFCGRFDALSFREAARCVEADMRIRLLAYAKAGEMRIFGGGRSEAMNEASKAYCLFLLELAKAEKDEDELLALLDDADAKLNLAFEQARN